jgi:hypothetical protein
LNITEFSTVAERKLLSAVNTFIITYDRRFFSLKLKENIHQSLVLKTLLSLRFEVFNFCDDISILCAYQLYQVEVSNLVTLKMEAMNSSETFVTTYKTTRSLQPKTTTTSVQTH